LHLAAPQPQPKPRAVENAPAPEIKIADRKLDPLPPSTAPAIPKQLVRTNLFSSGSSAPQTIERPAQQVQTGGFGDPNGIPAKAGQGKAVNIAQSGGFDLPTGPGYGNGTGGAKGATLTFMVGGSEAAFLRGHSLLEAMGRTIVHAGGSGNGQAAKICNNMILGISMIAVSEAFVLAEKLGLDHQKLFDISSKSSSQCWSLTNYCPVPGPVPASPANRDYQAGFTAAMMLKDLKLAQDAARSAGAATPLGAEAAALYGLYAAHGEAGRDFSGIILFLRGQ